MEWRSKTTFIIIFFLLTLQHSHSKTIVKSLPGFNGEFPFTLETGYIGIGDKEETQIFYYFVESERNPDEDPLILYIPGGPGASAILAIFTEIGPLLLDVDYASGNTKLTVNPNSWTKMANIIFLDIPAGTGFSYATTTEASISSDSIMAEQAIEFLRKFLISHPKFFRNPLYISGISYMGIGVPVITLGIYNANERGDLPTLNIQGYILTSPLTDKVMDFNSRVEFAHRMALISDDIYKSAVKNCHGDYFNTETANSLCLYSLERYNECVSRLNMEHILEPLCDSYCELVISDYHYIVKLLNEKAVQHALNVREVHKLKLLCLKINFYEFWGFHCEICSTIHIQGTIGFWQLFNNTLHYDEKKNDTIYYSYDIKSSFPYHKKLVRKNCRALIFSGDHDMTFPYVGVEQWISALNIPVVSPWKPFYVDNQVGGYVTTYAQNDFSLTYTTVKGAGHLVGQYKPKEALFVYEKWLTKNYHFEAPHNELTSI